MYAKHYENPTMLSRVTAKNVGDVFFWDTLYIGLRSGALAKVTQALAYKQISLSDRLLSLG